MPLQKQNISVSFAQGIDTKTDPRQVVPGKFEAVNNSEFTEGVALVKRNGFTRLTNNAGAVGRGIASFQDELVSFDDENLYSYVPESSTQLNKGYAQPVDFSSEFVYADTANQSGGISYTTSCIHSSGYIIYVYHAPTAIKYTVTSLQTNQVLAHASISGFNSTPLNGVRCFALGTNFIVAARSTSGGTNLKYVSIPLSNLGTPSAAVTIGPTGGGTGAMCLQGLVIGTKIYFVWNSPNGGNDRIAIRTLDSSLVLGTTTFLTATSNIVTAIGIWSDTQLATPQLWIAYYNNSDVYYFVINSSTLATVLASSSVATIATVVKLTGAVRSGAHTATLLVEQQVTLTAPAEQMNHILGYIIQDTNVHSSIGIIQEGVTIASEAFIVAGSYSYIYFIGTYGAQTGSGLEITNFIFRFYISGSYCDPVVKFANGSALPYPSLATAAASTTIYPLDYYQISQPTSQTLMFGFGKTQFVTSASGVITSSFAINLGTVDFSNNDLYLFQEAGVNLNFTGGFLGAYDSNYPAEQNFHLFPDSNAATYADTGGSIAKNPADTPYQYYAVYRWEDARGNIHKSEPSVALSIDISGSATDTNLITVTTMKCVITQKLNVFVDLYRNTPTAPGGNATDIFYYVTTANADTRTAGGSQVSISDSTADADIIGNQILYTTGGVVPNSGGPPCYGIVLYKNRLFVIDAENRNTLWFSKTILENTPVEMSKEFTLFAGPSFGNITVTSVMDDKLICFKQNAICYFTGNGPDDTGANNDFSDATSISSNVGCVNPRSIVTTQDGILFKSNKGIYLLDRGLGLTYIGAPVEAYNSYDITGAELIPDSTQVQFTLDGSTTCLMYDYFYKEWATFSLPAAPIAAVLYSDEFSFIDGTGYIYKESPGVYSDNGTAIYQSVTTSWLSFAGLQGYQRVYRLYLLTKYISAHNISVAIAYDFDPTIVQTVILDATTLASQMGTTAAGQWRVNIDRQKCQAIQITITELPDPTNPTIGAGLSIEALGFLVGSKLSYPKLPTIQSATS